MTLGYDQDASPVASTLVLDSHDNDTREGAAGGSWVDVARRFLSSGRPIVEVQQAFSATVDLTRCSVLTQGVCTCFALAVVCPATRRASVAHMSDWFAARLRADASEPGFPPRFQVPPTATRDAFLHLVSTLARAVRGDAERARVEVLIAGGTQPYDVERTAQTSAFVSAALLAALPDRLLHDHEPDIHAIHSYLQRRQPQPFLSFDPTSQAIAQRVRPLLASHAVGPWSNLGPALVNSTDTYVHKEPSQAKAHLMTRLYPDAVQREAASAGPMHFYYEAGPLMRAWMDEADMPGVVLHPHTHIGERSQQHDAPCLSLGVSLHGGEPRAFLWTSEPTTAKEARSLASLGADALPGGELSVRDALTIGFAGSAAMAASSIRKYGVFEMIDHTGAHAVFPHVTHAPLLRARLITTADQRKFVQSHTGSALASEMMGYSPGENRLFRAFMKPAPP